MEELTKESIEPKKRGKTPWIIVGVLLAVLAAAYLGLCAYAASLDTFYPNYRINGIDVGGLTAAQAQSALEKGLAAQEIILLDADSGEQVASLPLLALGYTAEDFHGDAQMWMEDLRSKPFPARGWTYLSFLLDRFPGGWHWPDRDAARYDAAAGELARTLSYEALDSSYKTDEQALSVTKAKDGRTVTAQALKTALDPLSDYSKDGYQVSVSFDSLPAKTLTAQEIYDAVSGEVKNAGYDAATDTITPEQVGADFDVPAAQTLLDAAAPGETVTIPARIELPKVTAEALQAVLFRDVLGECRTHVSGTAARISNVKLAAAAINGAVLNTGDVFSYNETTGQRTAAKGYQAAPAYVKGETVDEIGGGVCQPSSTLYYACLRANLEITERYAHRYIPAYITPGMDATVSWGGPDYKFTNNTDYPIKVVTSYAKGYLTIQLLGTKTDGVTVRMTSEKLSTTPFETVYEDDPTLAPGTETVKTSPYTGYKYKSYRNLYDADGKLISSTYEATSDYKSRNKVILRGPAVVTEPEAPVIGPAQVPAETPNIFPDAPPDVPEPPAEPAVSETELPVVIPEEPALPLD